MSRDVQAMFAAIAPRYDRANRILSFGIDRRWRKRAVRRSGAGAGARVLDLACGTGDLTFLFQKHTGREPVVGADFTPAMLRIAMRKTATSAKARPGVQAIPSFVAADALALPFASGTFDVASIAFGIRNVDDPLAGLREMARVTKAGGRVVVLEFGQPSGLWGKLYGTYARHVIPRIGGLVTGRRSAYEYLPRTAAAFPSGEAFLALMRNAGLVAPSATKLSGGIAYVYVGTVAPIGLIV